MIVNPAGRERNKNTRNNTQTASGLSLNNVGSGLTESALKLRPTINKNLTKSVLKHEKSDSKTPVKKKTFYG